VLTQTAEAHGHPVDQSHNQAAYELIPYIYSLALESHLTASPPQRWVDWGYETDSEVWTSKLLADGETQYWLLIGGVYQPGESKAKIYLPSRGPEDPGYINTSAPYQDLEAGQWVETESAWETSIPVLAKVGSAIAVGKDHQTLASGDRANPANLPEDDLRGIEIFPPKGDSAGRTFSTTWYEDDGISAAPEIASFTFSCSSTESEIRVKLTHAISGYQPAWKTLRVILSHGELRTVLDAWGKTVVAVSGPHPGREFSSLEVSL